MTFESRPNGLVNLGLRRAFSETIDKEVDVVADVLARRLILVHDGGNEDAHVIGSVKKFVFVERLVDREGRVQVGGQLGSSAMYGSRCFGFFCFFDKFRHFALMVVIHLIILFGVRKLGRLLLLNFNFLLHFRDFALDVGDLGLDVDDLGLGRRSWYAIGARRRDDSWAQVDRA